MTNATQQKRKRASPSCQDVANGEYDDVTNISPRDITNCFFERQGVKRIKVCGEFRGNGNKNEAEKENLNAVDAEHTLLTGSRNGSLLGNDGIGVAKLEKGFYLDYGLGNGRRNLEVGKRREEIVRDGESIMNEAGLQLGGQARSKEGYPIGSVNGGEEVVGKKRKGIETRVEGGMGLGSGYIGHENSRSDRNEAAAKCSEQVQREEMGTSSSSSVSKRSSRTRRTCTIYLQQTRGHRRAVAKARTERKRREKEEEIRREQLRMMEGMGAEEREEALERMENERREVEAARRRDLKRVKNRESVEKSRVRELVLEKQVGSEWDTLKKENECMMSVLEWFKRDLVVKNVRKEVNAVIRKRKKRKL